MDIKSFFSRAKPFAKKVLTNVLSLYIALAISFVLLLIFSRFVLMQSEVEERLFNFSRFVLMQSEVEQKLLLAKPKVLVLDMSVSVRDAPQSRVRGALLAQSLGEASPKELYLLDAIRAIVTASEDPNVKALLLHGSFLVDNYASSYSSLRDLRDALIRFKKSGKPIHAFIKHASMRDYFVASVADHLHIHPAGGMDLSGFSAEQMFLGDAFKKYGLEMQVIHAGKYKSYPEMFTRSEMSPENREQVQSVLDSKWEAYLSAIASSRGIKLEKLHSLSKKLAFFSPDEAVKEGLFDAVSYRDQVNQIMVEIAGYDEVSKSFNQMAFSSYITANKPVSPSYMTGAIKKKTLAVIYVQGAIVAGVSGLESAGSETLTQKLEEYRLDPNVEAIVLRVNSPGGGVMPSEEIQRQVKLAADAKPLYVSFGGVAASGGYWISTYAHKIFATPETITGSIGVFAMLPNIKKLGNDHGLTWDHVKTAPYAGALMTVSRPRSDQELAIFEKFIQQSYQDFIKKVAEGRNIPTEEVESLAQGRIWTGQQASKNKLVDEVGGLLDTILAASKAANLGNDFEIIEFPRQIPLVEQISKLLGAQQSAQMASDIPIRKIVSDMQAFINSLNDPKGIYARLPWIIEIK